jgi:pimeloyl-ACP methyl ester carboxylesterase
MSQSQAEEVQPGWYVTPGGEHVLVSPAPGAGYRRLDFANTSFGSLTIGDGEGEFRWLPSAAGGPALETSAGARWVPWSEAPYSVIEISFESSDGIPLEGLLLTPRSQFNRGAVISHGSGDSDRDNVWAYTFAHTLAANGVAVIFPDKRGSGASAGDWHRAGFDILARDATAAASRLARATSLGGESIGFVGLSQGGWVAPLAARFADESAFVISVSSAAVPVFDQIAFEVENTLQSEGFSADAVASARRLQEALRQHALGESSWDEYAEIRRSTIAGPAEPFASAMPASRDDWRWGWWARVGDYDPVGSWARTGVRTLVVYGGDDENDNVPVSRSVSRLRALSSRPDLGHCVRWEVFPGLGHALIDPETEWVASAVLERIVAFADAIDC